MKEAIEQLIKNLRESFPGLVPADDTELDTAVFNEPKEAIKDSQKKYLDRTILIDPSVADELISNHQYVDVANSPYPNNAVKAIWNLAIKAKQIFNGSYGNPLNIPSFINPHLAYLDASWTYAPLVVDETTLKLAYHFREFIAFIVNNKNALKTLPLVNAPFIGDKIKKASEDISKDLAKDALKTLDLRIGEYEARRPNSYHRAIADTKDTTLKTYNDIITDIGSSDNIAELFKLASTLNIDEDISKLQKLLDKIESTSSIILNIIYCPRENNNALNEKMYLTDDFPKDGTFVKKSDAKSNMIESLTVNIQSLTKLKPRFIAAFESLKTKIEEELSIKANQLLDSLPATVNEENKNQVTEKVNNLSMQLQQLQEKYKGFKSPQFIRLADTIDKYQGELKNVGLNRAQILRRDKVESNKIHHAYAKQLVELRQQKSRYETSVQSLKQEINAIETMISSKIDHHTKIIERLKQDTANLAKELSKYYGFNLSSLSETFRFMQLGTNVYIETLKEIEAHEAKIKHLKEGPHALLTKKSAASKLLENHEAFIKEYNSAIMLTSELIDKEKKQAVEIDKELKQISDAMKTLVIEPQVMQVAIAAAPVVAPSPAPAPQDTTKPERERLYDSALLSIDNYLRQRARTYYLEDKIRSVGETLFSIFGYRADANERKVFLNELKDALQIYRDTGNKDGLFAKIQEGINRFPPRSEVGKEYTDSLKYLLTSLRTKIIRQEQVAVKQPQSRIRP
jgi:hypothetical protein